MLSGAVPSALCPPAVLVVTDGEGVGGPLSTCLDAVADRVLATHALTLPAALDVLATARFDCVLAEVGTPDLTAAATAHALRTRARGAAVVLVVDDHSPVPDSFEELADLVLRAGDLRNDRGTDRGGDWLRLLRRAVEHARVRTSLRESEASVARLAGIMDSVADAVFTTTVDGRVATWNEGAERLYGYQASEMVGQSMAVLHPPGSDEPRRILAMVRAGKPIQGLKFKAMRPFRRDMQIVFQDPYGSLSPRMSITDIVSEGLRVHQPQMSAEERDRRAAAALKDVGLDPATRHRYPHEFSGGQRQRIAVARAMVLEPTFVVLDEPTSALDMLVQSQIVDLLRDLQKKRQLTYLFISHDLRVVAALASHVMVMKNGKIVEQGPAEKLFKSPESDYTRALFAAAFSLDTAQS